MSDFLISAIDHTFLKQILPPGWGIKPKAATAQDASQAIEEPLPASNVDIAEDDLGIDVNEGNAYESEGMVGLPDNSIVDTEASMSDGLGLGDEEYDDKDGDYVMETNLKSDEEEFEIEPVEVQRSTLTH